MRLALFTLVGASIAAVAACSDGSPCDGFRQFGLVAPDDSLRRADWIQAVAALVANAPGDSIVSVGVFMVPESKQVVRDWGMEYGANNRYEFTGFSAIAFYAPVRALPDLLLLTGVTYVDLDNSEGYPAC